jgi:very-short-patch-repair endonuclease
MAHFTTPGLAAVGIGEKQLRRLVSDGSLIRLRRGHFATPNVDLPSRTAVQAGGSVACVSELRHLGIWVLDSDVVHVRVPSNAARLPSAALGARIHWDDYAPVDAEGVHVGVIAALIQAYRCLDHRAWIASVDSALHTKRLSRRQLSLIASRLPASAGLLISQTDRSAESGLESIVRVLARELGFRVRSQVRFPGVGWVDLVIEKWIVVETDGTAFHDQALSPRDRRRDALLSARQRVVLRPGYSLVVHDQPAVARQIIGAVAAHRRVGNSGKLAARARRRAVVLGLS